MTRLPKAFSIHRKASNIICNKNICWIFKQKSQSHNTINKTLHIIFLFIISILN